MTSLRAKTFGGVSFLEVLLLIFNFAKSPIVLPLKFLASPLFAHNREKSWKRVLGDIIVRYITNNFTYNQLQRLGGTTLDVYKSFPQEPVIDELGENARLLWIGPKRLDKVILYCHGGGYLFAPMAQIFPFFDHVQRELEKRGKHIGIAMLSYSLVPNAKFPTPLSQAVLALNFLLKSGVHPSNIQLVGDSAGANLVLQLLSHILHSHPSVPSLTLPSPLNQVYLMSPWVDLTGENMLSFDENTRKDIFNASTIRAWGAAALADVPIEETPYMQPLKAPLGWFEGLDKIVAGGILVSTSRGEMLRDPVVLFYENHIKPAYSDDGKKRIIIQKGGVHNEPYLAAGMGEFGGEVTPAVVDWIEYGFE